MTVLEFLEKYTVLLEHDLQSWLQWRTDNSPNTPICMSMAKAWDEVPDPIWLAEILKCEANPNYDPSLLQYLRFCFDNCFSRCTTPIIRKKIGNAIENLDSYRGGMLTIYNLRQFHSEIDGHCRRVVLESIGSADEREAIYTVQSGLGWLGSNGNGVLFAIWHVLKRLSPFTNKNQFADKFRECLGNPYA